MSTRSFMSQTTPDNVGPGLYNITNKQERYHAPIPFGSTTRREIFPSPDQGSGIGPGSYNPVDLAQRSHSAISFPRSRPPKYYDNTRDSPGPCAHSTLSNWVLRQRSTKQSNLPRQPFGAEDRRQNPGPGDYNPITIERQRVVDFSASRVPQREPVIDNGVPGPGDYTIDRSISEKPIPLKPTPGFRASKPDAFPDAKYDATMLNHSAWKAEPPSNRPFGGLAKRDIFGTGQTSSVGPGEYDIREISKPVMKRGDFGIDRETIGMVHNDNPGPGYYGQSFSRLHGQASIPRAKRGNFFSGATQGNPGPGRYDITYGETYQRRFMLQNESSVFKDARKKRTVLDDDSEGPGPAIYYPREERKNALRVSNSRRFGRDETDNPGPGAYGRAEMLSTPSGGYISGGSRFNTTPNDVPGPGSYYNMERHDFVKRSFNSMFNPSLE